MNLWWVYDSESRQYFTLPAGPLLIPVFILGLFVGALSLFQPRNSVWVDPRFLNSEDYMRYKRRYEFLIEKRFRDPVWERDAGLSLAEWEELRWLEQPPWANGERWNY
jgi:hypothetical protein